MLYLALIILFLAFADVSVVSAKEAVSVFLYSVLPSLLPFFILSKMLLSSSLPGKMSNSLSPLMLPLFGVPGAGAAALIPGLLCGYPVGAAACADLRKNGHLTEVEAQRLSASTSNTGPFFVVGAVGAAFCRSTSAGIVLLATHIAAGLAVGILFRFKKPTQVRTPPLAPCETPPLAPRQNPKPNLGTAVAASVKDVANVGGYIVFFSVIIGIIRSTGVLATFGEIFLGNNYKIFEGTISGMIEMTTGCGILAETGTELKVVMPFLAFIIGFGGLAVHAQIISILNKANIRAMPFVIGKISQGILASFFTYLILKFEPISKYITNSIATSTAMNEFHTSIIKNPPYTYYVLITTLGLTLLIHHLRLRLSS